MKIIFIIKLLVGLLVSSHALGKVSQLQDIQSKTEKGYFTTKLIFDRPLQGNEYSVEYINETVQVNIPGAEVSGKKRFQPYKGKLVRNLYTYQVDEDLLRHRIILKQGEKAIQFKKKIQMEKKGSSLIVRIPQKSTAMSSIIKELPEKIKIKETAPVVAKDVIDEEEEEMKRLILAASQVTSVQAKPSVSEKAINSYQSSKNKKQKVESKKTKDLVESEIPVLVKKEEKKASGSIYMRLLFSFVIVGLLGLGAFLGLKKYRHQGLLKNSHTSIKMTNQHYLGPKKSLAIVRVAGESILIGITDQNISHIKTLSLMDEEVPEISAEAPFTESLATEAVHRQNESVLESGDKDEFSIKGIKDLVSTRLNGMRDL